MLQASRAPTEIPADVSRFVAHYFGASGRAWLEQLPAVIASAATRWDLDIEHPLSGGLLSCVLATRRRDATPAVLKIAGPWAPARHEALALEHWDGGPAPRLLDFDDRLSALLLERIWPGDVPAGESCDQVARLISTLHAAPPTRSQMAVLPSLAEAVEQQFVTAAAEASARSEAEFAALAPKIQRARHAAAELLGKFAGPSVLLHGDLEQRNIVRCQQRGLAAIDTVLRRSVTPPMMPPTGQPMSKRVPVLSSDATRWLCMPRWIPAGCWAGLRSSPSPSKSHDVPSRRDPLFRRSVCEPAARTPF